MKFNVGDRVWVRNPPVFMGSRSSCIGDFTPRWGVIESVDDYGYDIRTETDQDKSGYEAWWYYPEDITDPFLAICQEVLDGDVG